METGSTSLGEDYQKLESAVLYWHKTSGYIYDPVRGGREREREREGGGEGNRLRKRDIDIKHLLRLSSIVISAILHPIVMPCVFPQVNQQFCAPTSSYYGQQQATATIGQTSQSSQAYAAAQSTQVDGASTSGTGQTSQASISDMLAAASERVLERCGLEYDEMAGMYYDANSALYYDQV